MKVRLILIAIAFLIVVIIGSCTKAGTGGDATVVCTAGETDSSEVDGVSYYVKYGQSTPPSNNNSGYDDHKDAAPAGNYVSFVGLKKGIYYFYAEATIPKNGVPTKFSGGTSYTITESYRKGTGEAFILLKQ